MSLSVRLKAMASFYQDHSSIWDIGCDHGLLGLSFLPYPLVHSIHLVDPSACVMDELKKKLVDSYITVPEKIKIYQQFGQNIKLDIQQKIIFIAGMGGREIIQIIKNLGPQIDENDRLIISPHRHILEVRNYLQTTEFRLIDEKILNENEQFYQILGLSKNPSLEKVSAYGTKVWQGEVGKDYLNFVLKFQALHQDCASKSLVSYLKSLK